MKINEELSSKSETSIFVNTVFGEKGVSALKDMFGIWNSGYQAWMLHKKHEKAVRELIAGLLSGTKTPAVKEAATSQNTQETQPHPDTVLLRGKVRYKGRVYYATWIGYGKKGYSARLVSLPGEDGKYIEFWAAVEAEPTQWGAKPVHDGNGSVGIVLKVYTPKEIDGNVVVQTLGSIKKFIDEQKAKETPPAPAKSEPVKPVTQPAKAMQPAMAHNCSAKAEYQKEFTNEMGMYTEYSEYSDAFDGQCEGCGEWGVAGKECVFCDHDQS